MKRADEVTDLADIIDMAREIAAEMPPGPLPFGPWPRITRKQLLACAVVHLVDERDAQRPPVGGRWASGGWRLTRRPDRTARAQDAGGTDHG